MCNMTHTLENPALSEQPVCRDKNERGSGSTLSHLVVLCALAAVAIVVWFNHKVNVLMERVSPGGTTSPSQLAAFPGTSSVLPNGSHSACAYPFIYNKPHKTGSSYISTTVRQWAAAVGRPQFRCSGFDHLTAIRLQECLPKEADGCGVLNCHIHIVPELRGMLAEKLPRFRLVTSTRYAPHRILSFYMQRRHYSTPNESMIPDVKHFLRYEFNPYSIVAYHTEVPMQLRTCPLAVGDEENIMSAVSKYHVVVDLTLKQESNAILEKAGLFTFESSIQPKSRGSAAFPMDAELYDLLYNVSCYERAMHNALLLRMASLYEAATDSSCIKHGRLHLTSSCLHQRQRQILNDTWLF